MEVVPTDDGEEDNVLWLRCPCCQGYLPKISAGFKEALPRTETPAGNEETVAETNSNGAISGDVTSPPGEMALVEDEEPGATLPVSERESEPIADYAAMLAEQDLTSAKPYRSWEQYEIGDVIHHLAWDDCGVVVAKETLPGNRRIVKVFFEKTGVVRLIEEDSSTS